MADAKTRRLKSADAAYLAGLIDGEGTVTLSREQVGENGRLAVTISNTELAILKFVVKVSCVGKITNKRTYSHLHTPSYCYKVTNRQALALLEQIAPYMHSYKRKRAALALKHYLPVTQRNGRYTASQLKSKLSVEKIFLAIKP